MLPYGYSAVFGLVLLSVESRLRAARAVLSRTAELPRGPLKGPSGNDAISEVTATLTGVACITNALILMLSPTFGWQPSAQFSATTLAFMTIVSITAFVLVRALTWHTLGASTWNACCCCGRPAAIQTYIASDLPNTYAVTAMTAKEAAQAE